MNLTLNNINIFFFIKKSLLRGFQNGVSDYHSTEEIRQIYLINAFNLIGFVFVFPLGIHALLFSLPTLAFTLLSISFILVLNYFFLRFTSKIMSASYIISSIFFILFCYLIYTGGINKTGPLWVYSLPMLVMFLLGFRQGIVYMALFFVIILFILFGLDSPLYSDAFKLRIVLSLLLVTFLTSIYEYIREKNFESMHLLSTQLEEVSQQDYLTKVYNRRGINKEFENLYTSYRIEDHKFSLLLCDIDYFKKINDNYGHDAGDKVLKKIASEIKNIIRKDDVLARWGGEEFLVLLPHTSIHEAHEVGEKIRQSIQNTSFKYNGHTISMTVSIGIAEKEDELLFTDIISKADAHMYAAKREGRNTVYPKPKIEL